MAGRILSRTKWVKAILAGMAGPADGHGPSPSARAISWVRTQELPSGGLKVHSGHPNAYPEVTGYFVPTLLLYGERELATRLVRWLVAIQRANGSYPDPNKGLPYIFDTGQILRGLLAGVPLVPEAEHAARRAADYLCASMVDAGRAGFGVCYADDPMIPETIQLYALPPLVEAAEVFQQPAYREAAERCFLHYVGHPHYLQVENLTHFLAYEIEALIDLGRADLAQPVLDKLQRLQRPDGAVRGKGGKEWVCTPGLAQLAVCWYKIDQRAPADLAMEWLERHQCLSGGFFGSYGPDAAYFEGVELLWAAKYYLDANSVRVASFFETNATNAADFPDTIESDDGRVLAVLSAVKLADSVLDVGCGKGRFLRLIREVHPETRCVGVDISRSMLGHVGRGIETRQGRLESIPVPDNSFDVVFSVEAIEHSANPQAVVSEMVRAARPGGWVIVIDKQQSHWGRMQPPPWERWPKAEELVRLLRRDCDDVTVEPIAYGDRPSTDGMIVAWRGRKRHPPAQGSAEPGIGTEADVAQVVHRVRFNKLREWDEVLPLWTASGQSVLAVGTSTVETSLRLAQSGRKVVLLSYGEPTLHFARACANELGIEIGLVPWVRESPFPFADGAFGCVYQSGLLEYLAQNERFAVVKEAARVASERVIALVPNASCVAYRAGKARQEEQGTWAHGLGMPLTSLKEEFEGAGLRVVDEYSVGARHALNFLNPNDPLRRALASWMAAAPPGVVEGSNQGYLVITVGEKRPG